MSNAKFITISSSVTTGLLGGLEVLMRGLVFACQTVTTFVSSLHGGEEITVDDVIDTIEKSLHEV